MAFDQNYIPKELRPINIGQTVAEDSCVLPATTTGRSSDSYQPNSAATPHGVPFFHPATVSDARFVNIGYGHSAQSTGPAALYSHLPVHIGHQGLNHPAAIGLGYPPNLGNWFGAGNAVDHATGAQYAQNYSTFVGSNGVGQALSDMGSGVCSSPSLVNRVRSSAAETTGTACNNYLTDPVAAKGVEQVNDEAVDDSVSGRKIKFLCSFGGKILPRPVDGMLRYVGGHTRIISVQRDVSFNELVQNMVDIYGQVSVIKYQLPDEDLDALVSVSCPDDLDNMMEEYEKLRERTSDGSAKLRMFLFSPSEGDPSGMAQFVDLTDSGQKFFNAVNGLADECPVSITRKDSNSSAVSTQTSDFSGSEFPDHSVHSQGNNVSAAPLSSVLSPREITQVSHDNNTNAIARDSTPVDYSDVSGVPKGVVASKAGLTQASFLQTDIESGRRVMPLGSTQQHIGLQKPITESHVPVSYLHPFVQHQDVINRTEHIQHSHPTVFQNPRPLANEGPGFSRKQFYENIAPLGPNHVMPAIHVTVTPPTSHISTRQDMVRPLVQHQQNQWDLYAGEGAFGARVMQLPAEHNYYQVQGPSVVGGGYGWHQVQPPEHVLLSDGFKLHQQVPIPKKFQGREDNLMCQKASPHGHSDTLLHDERDSAACSISDVTPVFHNVHLGDKLISAATSGVLKTAPPGEVIIEKGVGFSPRALNHAGLPVSVPHTGTSGQSQNLELQPEGGRSFTRKTDVFYDQHNEVTQDMIGKAVDDAAGQRVLSAEGQVRGDELMNKPIINGMLPSSTIAKMSEHAVKESPKERVSKIPFILSKSEAEDNHVTYDQLRPIDGRMKTVMLQHPVTNEHNKLPFDISKGGNSDHTPNQVIVKEMLVDNNFGRSEMVFEGNKLKKTDMLPTPYSQSMIRNHLLDFNYDNPSLYAVDPSNIPVQPPEVISTSVNTPTASHPSGITGDLQENPNSLFSNQEPWNMQCDSYLPPSRSDKVCLQKESFSHIDPFSDNHLGNYEETNFEGKPGDGFYQPLSSSKQDLSSEHSQSDKGSAEEKIKQELQAVAEGVAASVFLSSVPSTSDLQDMSDSTREDIEVENFSSALPRTQRKANAQDATEISEKVYLGFPMSDGVGRLQIIKNSDLEELMELGSGTFGTVYHGKWRGSDVAIKRISNRCFAGKASEQERLRNDFWNEAIKLADLHHPNVVAFYGVVLDGPGGSVATITEFMVNGSLRTALLKNGRCLDMRKLLLIAMDVGFGMEYLHGKNIVHFDLKSDNLLVNLRDPQRPICKVGDLGLSKVKCQTLISGGVRGTLPWMAPELLNGSSSLVSEKVDVFSFGIVMWELLTGEEPYADLHYGAIIGGIVSNTLRPPIPDSCDPELRSLLESCWSSEPSERPSFTEIVNNLRSMAAKISPKSQILQSQPPSNLTQAQK